MKGIIIPIIIAVLGSNGLFSFIQFLLTRKNKIIDKLDYLEKLIISLQQDITRLQLLVLIKLSPERVDEIMTVENKYFCSFKGNWYLTKMFDDYLNQNKVYKPKWFDIDKHCLEIDNVK